MKSMKEFWMNFLFIYVLIIPIFYIKMFSSFQSVHFADLLCEKEERQMMKKMSEDIDFVSTNVWKKKRVDEE